MPSSDDSDRFRPEPNWWWDTNARRRIERETGRDPGPLYRDTDYGKPQPIWWGSDCRRCRNATPCSMVCDACFTAEDTEPLFQGSR